MTTNREDYLKTIYILEEKNDRVTNKIIANHFDIAPSSVSEMLKKLQKEGYIYLEKTNIFLTEKGKKKAEEILNIHRIWETFLVDFLNFEGEEIHQQAELLEHVTSKELFEKLNAYLKYPKNCPHGSKIYCNLKEGENE